MTLLTPNKWEWYIASWASEESVPWPWTRSMRSRRMMCRNQGRKRRKLGKVACEAIGRMGRW